MKEKQRKYAEIILKECLKLEKNQPLVISGSYESYEFVRLLAQEAIKIGARDIEYDLSDSYIKKAMYENYTIEELKEHSYYKRETYNEYAKKNAAVLMLSYEYPNQMKDIDPEKITEIRKYGANKRLFFNEKREKNELAWCIACVPNIDWAKQVYPDSKKPLEDLWESIFEITCVNEENSINKIEQDIAEKENICQKLNEIKIKRLEITNKLGTNLTMELFDKTIWCSGITELKNGKKILVNYPSIEVFTSPKKDSVNGIVYSTMPLLTNGVVINKFSLKLENGKIIEVKAEEHQELLEKLINTDEGANYIGEVALVPYDSPIRNKETLFYTTLLDENAACHLAFGDSFTECYEGAEEMSKEERLSLGLNVSKTHIDFMFGSEDLKIVAKTFNDEEIILFENGNYKDII